MISKLVILVLCIGIEGKDFGLLNSSFMKNNVSNQGPACHRTDFQMIFFACLIIFIPITILGNAVVCFVVGYTMSLRKQPMYMYIASLALADTFVGIISMPLKAKIEWDGGCFRLPWWLCWIFVLEEITFSVASTIHLFAIGIDRFLALQFAYKYKRFMSRKTYITVIMNIWVISICWSILCIFQWSRPSSTSIIPGMMGCSVKNKIYFTTMLSLFYILPVFLLMFIYWHIYKIAVRHVHEITKVEIHVSRSERRSQRRKRHLKLLRSVIIVFLAFVICWLPCTIFVLIIQNHKPDFVPSKETWFRPVKFIFIDFLPHLNSTLNPFIYVLSNKEFIIAAQTFFGRNMCNSNIQSKRDKSKKPHELILMEKKVSDHLKSSKLSSDSNTNTI